MTVINKYSFDTRSNTGITSGDILEIAMPVEAKLLSIGVQEEQLVFWALVDMDKPMIYRMFRLFLTGEKFEGPLQGYYFGSAKIGYLVWHVFDIGEKP